MSFGIPVRNGLAIGLLASTYLSSRRAAYPAMSLNFLQPFLDSRVTFSRGSNATLVDSTGKITYAPANLVTFSQEFNNGAWTKGNTTVTANSTAAPDGTTTADTIAATATAATFLFRDLAFPASTGAYSFYIKADNIIDATTSFLIQDITAGSATRASGVLQWSTMTIISGSGSSITAVGNGWHRVSLFSSSFVMGNTLRLWINTGSTVTAGHSFFLWGAQLEPVTYQTTPSTYVATTTAAYYGPRFDYDPVTLAPKGLLIEEQRTNIILYSSDFTNASWTKSLSAMAGTFTTAPDGTNTGAKWREDVTLAEHQIYAGPTLTAALYTETWYLKAAERTKVRVSLATAGLALGASVIADLSAGTLSAVTNLGGHTGATAIISSAGNGWYRVSLTITATATTYYPALTMVTGTSTVSYTGDGVSGIFIWGAQLEAGSFATSYIPTVASLVTRSADVATMTGTNFSSWYNQSEGTFVVGYDSAASGFGVLGNNTSGYVLASSTRDLKTFNGTTSVASANTLAVGAIGSGAVSYDSTGRNVVLNGGAVATAAGVLQTITTLFIGHDAAFSGARLNGHIRSIAYYNTRLPNATLQTLTAPPLTTTLTMSFTNQAYTVGV